MNNIKKNLGFQTIYQILNTCLPLITAPYLARVLGAKQLGVFSYTSSVVAYFALVAMLGTINYGTRSIASVKQDVKERSKTFFEIYLLQVLMSIVAMIAYIIYLLMFCKNNFVISSIQVLTLISCLFDISWFFFGIENFKITVTVSMFFRVITVIGILFLVRSPQDLWIYTILMLGGTLVSQIVLWGYIPKYIKFVKISFKNLKNHLKGNMLLFVPLLAMSVYHTMDKTMLGVLSTYEQSGYYYNADKVINIPLCVINGIGTVMLPRMTSLYASKKNAEGNKLFLISTEGVAVVSVAMAFGIAAISKEFIPLFFGNGYEACIRLTLMLSPVLIIKGFSNTARTQYLVPLRMENIFTKSVLVGAITNLIFNLLLIPRLGAMGAVIGTLLAELISCVWQFVYMQKTIDLRQCLKASGIYILFGIIMFFAVRITGIISLPTIPKLIIEVGIGGLTFCVLCFGFWKITKNNMYKIIFGSYISKIPIMRKLL